jgi:DNA-binding transcriptional MerR regulator
MEPSLRVGQLAEVTSVPAKTTRYYEQVGVLPAPSRSAAGYRQYYRRDIQRLLFIRRARSLGLPLAQLRDLTAGLEGKGCTTMLPLPGRGATQPMISARCRPDRSQSRIRDFRRGDLFLRWRCRPSLII